MPRTLQFLDFDFSEDFDGLRSWSALASPTAAHSAALQAEVQALLHDLNQQLGAPGPLDEGHLWDMALSVEPEADRITLSLDICGHEALRECLDRWLTP